MRIWILPKSLKFSQNPSFYLSGTEVFFSTRFNVSLYELTNFQSKRNQACLHKIRIGILLALDPYPNQVFRSGTCKKVWILFDLDQQH